MDCPGFHVRLDALLEAGGDRELAMEQWHRPPEEWERFRPVFNKPQQLRRYESTPRARLDLAQLLTDRAFSVSSADAAELLGADDGFTSTVTVEPLEP